MPITRRAVLGILSSSTFFLTVPTRADELPTTLATGSAALRFAQGVASGDPRSDSVMLWTRAEPAEQAVTENVPVLLQVSEDESFSSVVLESLLTTSEASDYTLRAYVDGLQADRYYYYRFLGGADSMSRTGRTRTAPAADQTADVTLAFASCQSFEQGYYGSWARMIADDQAAPEEAAIRFVLHLGDFIYERSWNTRYDGSDQSRYVPEFPDGVITDRNRHAVSLADYRHIYRTYLGDPWLQEARARWPFICVWDDHEFSNDNFQSYNNYGDRPKLEAQRRQDSNQAWFEFIPTVLEEAEEQPAYDFRAAELASAADSNAAARDSLCIYRSLRWGKNLDIVLTDNRSYRSAPCLDKHAAAALDLPMNTVNLVKIADGGSSYNNGQPPEFLPYGDGTVPNFAREREPGSCLGHQQREWFLAQLDRSTARWKLWGNSIPLLPLRLDLSSVPLAGYEDSLFTIDPWAGFPHEVSLLMDHLEANKVTGLVSLSGDHHMHGAATINRAPDDPEAPAVAVDFAVAGISSSPTYEDAASVARKGSPGFRSLVFSEADGKEFPLWNMTLSRGVLASMAYDKTGLATLAEWLGPNEANPGLKFVDTLANGYGLARFREDAMDVSFITMSDLSEPFEEAPPVRYRANFTLPLWGPGEEPELAGPTFEGPAPFPFAPPPV